MTAAGDQPHQIITTLHQMNPDILVTPDDIYNLRKAIKQTNLGARTPIEALFDQVKASNWHVEFQTDNTNRLTHLFLMHPVFLSLYTLYPDVLLMDCTYKTNCFKMPLLSIVGSTNLNTTFFVTFVFITAEIEEDYA